jgi:beta-galactosidase
MSHNATGYNEDMNPDMIDGLNSPRDTWAANNAKLAQRAEAIVKRLDPGRIVYHHSSGNLSSMHTINFYPNWVPIQEMSDWFEHWSTQGVKPVFTCEYSAPMTWDWTMYRGWYKGKRTFGSAAVPWEFCLAEWDAQFLGDRVYQLGEREKRNLRWEAKQFRDGKVWKRWDYPTDIGSSLFEDRHTVTARYVADNWRAFRTWGMSANSPWDHSFFWRLPQKFTRKRQELAVDWDSLQRPGLSPDYLDDQFERIDMAYAVSDWEPTVDAKALLRNNQPLLAYIGGKPARFTSKDHNFTAGETVEKQLILINNSRVVVRCDWEWSFALPQPVTGRGTARVPTGEQQRIAITAALPAGLAAGSYELTATARFSNGETQRDTFTVHVLPRLPRARASAALAVFDPKGETTSLLRALGLPFVPVGAETDLASHPVLVIGRGALTVDGPAPDLSRVRQGLKVLMFEQSSEALEKRLGFRVTEYGLRQAFARVPDHPLLAGLGTDHLRDWRGEATLVSPRLKYTVDDEVFNGAPAVKWCDIPVTRVWRCGNRGNVASVLIEKPARGSFLPLTEGGYGLQYSPLLEYREGKGMILFCQMDVTGRSEADPAAETLARRLFEYVARWQPAPSRQARYVGDPAGRRYLAAMGLTLPSYNGTLTADQVLIVGPGGEKDVAPHAAAIASWLKSGGHLLAIGLQGTGASTFLPFPVTTKQEEHIATWFEPFPANSPLAGVSPGDLASRDPRTLSLVSGGASVVGNGVLAVGEHTGVVFSGLVPWEFDWQKQMNLKRTFRRVSVLTARLLGNMGVSGATPLLGRFHEPVKATNPEKRWLEGLYLDQPEEWDDPYRFFRW